MAATSLATKFSPSPSPMSNGLPFRAATILSGSRLEITAMPYVPSTRSSASITAASRLPVNAASIRCASTSVSVSDLNTWPASISRFRSTPKFSMMPLCTTAIEPEQSRCGCAFFSLGAPCVAHRVWPMPTDPPIGCLATADSSIAILPLARRISTPSSPSSATPAES